MNNKPHIIVEHTADGSATLYVKELDEHYHSVKGALTEAEHIYRDCAFMHRSDGTRLRLLEIGFGTGLNAVVTAMAADADHPVHYISLEKYPVETQLLSALAYNRLADGTLLQAIHAAEWGKPVAITPYFTLEKRQA
ncbi:MAG: SAM-dependent methyltransferase, partial [Bacteroidales bacterium]|nr:SAM-dependent methyltransferase [Bacteroidales bacterium]